MDKRSPFKIIYNEIINVDKQEKKSFDNDFQKADLCMWYVFTIFLFRISVI